MPYRTLAIDPGIRNIGWALFEDRKLINFGVHDMMYEGIKKAERTQYPELVKKFIDSEGEMFNSANAVIIERQMHARLKVIQTAFQCFLWEASVLVSPISMRKHHGVSTGDYRDNKRASIARAPKYMSVEQKQKYVKSPKRDDIADAVLLAAYHVDNHFQRLARQEAEEKIRNIIMVQPETMVEESVAPTIIGAKRPREDTDINDTPLT